MAHSQISLINAARFVLRGEDLNDGKFDLDKVAISVFEQWLGPENLDLLNCRDRAERDERNNRMISFWLAIYDSYDVLCRSESEEFVVAKDRKVYESQCLFDGEKPSTNFQCIVIPELSAIYYESWDDTNVLWYHDRTDVKPLLNIAKKCGLHLLEYAG